MQGMCLQLVHSSRRLKELEQQNFLLEKVVYAQVTDSPIH